jgi:hypothetical protein
LRCSRREGGEVERTLRRARLLSLRRSRRVWFRLRERVSMTTEASDNAAVPEAAGVQVPFGACCAATDAQTLSNSVITLLSWRASFSVKAGEVVDGVVTWLSCGEVGHGACDAWPWSVRVQVAVEMGVRQAAVRSSGGFDGSATCANPSLSTDSLRRPAAISWPVTRNCALAYAG